MASTQISSGFCYPKELSTRLKIVLVFLLVVASTSVSAVQEVNLTLTDGVAAEAGQDPAIITITRSDDGNLATGISVHIAVTGKERKVFLALIWLTFQLHTQPKASGNMG